MEQSLTQLVLASAHSKAEGAGRRIWRGITVPSLLLEVTMGGGSRSRMGTARVSCAGQLSVTALSVAGHLG